MISWFAWIVLASAGFIGFRVVEAIIRFFLSDPSPDPELLHRKER